MTPLPLMIIISKQLSLTEHSAELSNELEINNILPQSIQAEIRINYSFEKGEETVISRSVTLQPGPTLSISLPKSCLPVRWMPNGWGKPAFV